MLKLNLGCGIYYKPGYVNLDLNEDSIADRFIDISNLPYENKTVDEIEASHILEHFDIIVLPYILSEWYRVLKSGGVLYVETPDLVKSTRRIRFSTFNKKRSTLRFLFGIDIPGNIHKMGFDFNFLKKTLALIGFKSIKRIKQTSFKKEKAIRLEAIKPSHSIENNKTHLFTNFRWVMFKNLDKQNIRYFEALENSCVNPLFKLVSANFELFFKTEILASLIATFAIFDPSAAKTFLQILSKEVYSNLDLEILEFLEKINSPSVFMNLWKKWKKQNNRLQFSLAEFYSYWNTRIRNALLAKYDWKETFEYLLTQTSEHLDFFSLEQIIFYSTKYLNLGIRAFTNGDLQEAKTMFENCLKINHESNLAIWNLIRLQIKLSDYNHVDIISCYQTLISNLKNIKYRKKAKEELKKFKEKQIDLICLKPIQIR